MGYPAKPLKRLAGVAGLEPATPDERQRIKLGTYPMIKLKDARELARTRLAEIVLG